MAEPSPIPGRIILINVLLVLLWLPLIYGARTLVSRVAASAPSDDLLQATYLAVVGTLVIVTSAYVFGLVLFNKFVTQNIGGAQPRIVRPLVIGAIVLYAAVGIALFTTI
jgi:hypothetical protein